MARLTQRPAWGWAWSVRTGKTSYKKAASLGYYKPFLASLADLCSFPEELVSLVLLRPAFSFPIRFLIFA